VVTAEDKDYERIDTPLLANMAFKIFLIREFENTLLTLADEGCIHGPVHTSIGHEACAAGAMATLKPSDKIGSTHRAHHHYLAKLVSCFMAEGFDITKNKIPGKLLEQITELMGEVMGLSIGCCGGRGGSMHLRNEKIGVAGTNAIVAGGIPLATGTAFSSKYSQDQDIVICFMGDGAVNQGAFHEALNLAAIWELPIAYVIENNYYAVGTRISDSTTTEDLARKGSAYTCPTRTVDGMDPVAVMNALNEAGEHIRKEHGPVLIEAKCYRYLHHAGPVPGSNFGYRTKEEEQKWHKLDPCITYPDKLIKQGLFTQVQIDKIRSEAVTAVKNSMDRCTEMKGSKPVVKKDLWPDIRTVEQGLRSDGAEFTGITFREGGDFSEFDQISYSDAIAAVTGRNLEKDDRVFILGEEVANFGGGPYGATKGLPAIYPDRILNTPISEAGFVGLAGGAAMSGLRPVVEIMFPDFSLVAADQLFNQIGKLRHIYGNTTEMPLVVRTRIAIGCGYGGQHSMDPVGLYSLFGGWRIVAPSNAFDYIGLFNSAMLSKDPVLIVEHHQLYPLKFDIPENNFDYHVELGKSRIIRHGKDVTVLCYSAMVNLCLEAAENLVKDGISAELIDLRTISPNDIDYVTIGESLTRTGAMIIVEQAPGSMSIGPVISHECQKQFFDSLDGPIACVSGLDIPNPVSKPLEIASLPDLDSVQGMISRAARREL
jgi:2-oxoisovalerate dehydrogenase E1 component